MPREANEPLARAQALIAHTDPSKPVLAFYTSIQSIGLTHYSRALMSAFIKGEDQNLRKRQDDDAAKRAVPKL